MWVTPEEINSLKGRFPWCTGNCLIPQWLLFWGGISGPRDTLRPRREATVRECVTTIWVLRRQWVLLLFPDLSGSWSTGGGLQLHRPCLVHEEAPVDLLIHPSGFLWDSVLKPVVEFSPQTFQFLQDSISGLTSSTLVGFPNCCLLCTFCLWFGINLWAQCSSCLFITTEDFTLPSSTTAKCWEASSASASVAPLACADLVSDTVHITATPLQPSSLSLCTPHVILAAGMVFGVWQWRGKLKSHHQILGFLSLIMTNDTWISCLFEMGAHSTKLSLWWNIRISGQSCSPERTAWGPWFLVRAWIQEARSPCSLSHHQRGPWEFPGELPRRDTSHLLNCLLQPGSENQSTSERKNWKKMYGHQNPK